MTIQDAANALLAALPNPYGGSGTFRIPAATVTAFQQAYASEKGMSGGVDGVWGPATQSWLAEYVTLPPNAPGVVNMMTTHATPAQMAASIGRGYQTATGKVPSHNMLQTLTAQAMVETSSGQAMNNYNFGNVHGKNASGQSFVGPDKDKSGNIYYTNFRAYDSLDDGAADYVKLITGSYSNTLPYAEQNDLAGFAQALKTKGYYEATVADYTAGLQAKNAAAGLAASAWTPGGGVNPVDDSSNNPSLWQDVVNLFEGHSTQSALAPTVTNPDTADNTADNTPVAPPPTTEDLTSPQTTPTSTSTGVVGIVAVGGILGFLYYWLTKK